MNQAHYRCAICHNISAVQWAHLAGRRHLVAEPWASSPFLTVALCPEHHADIDANRNPISLHHLRYAAFRKLTQIANLILPPEIQQDALIDPLGAIKRTVAILESQQFVPYCCHAESSLS